MLDTKSIIEKWYKKIGFSSSYDKEFYKALDEYEINPDAKIEDYDINCEDGRKNLLYYLYFCEDTEKRYKDSGIPDDVLMDTLEDISRWLDIWSDLKGSMYLGELDWLSYHLKARLFKLGRLQFCFANHYEIPQRGIKKGDSVIDTHIPAAGPLDAEECRKSFDFAREFFSKYFPDYKWEVFTCHSWLLGEDFAKMLGEDSNIVKFQRMYNIYEQYESDAVLSYVFRWKIKRARVLNAEAKSGFAKKLKALVQEDAVFHGGGGYIDR